MSLKWHNFYLVQAAGILLLAACHNGSNRQAQQQGKKDTAKAAVVDTITPEIATYTKRITSNPSDANAYWNRGKLEILQKNTGAALVDLTKAVHLDSTKADYYYSLANVNFISGHTRESKDDFEKCIQLDPHNTDALLKLGEIYFYVRKYKESMALIDKALEINDHLAKAYFMKGMIFLEIHDTAKAISSMQTAVEQNSNYFDAYIQLGLIYSRKGNPHAIDYFNAALNIDPHSAEPYYDKGMFYQSKNDYANAIQSYNDLLQVDSTYKFALYNLGFIYYVNNKDYEKAAGYFTRALKSDTGYTMAYYARGNCYEQLNKLNEALADFSHAVTQRPGFTAAIASYKEVKAKMNR